MSEKGWCAETTNYPREVAENALAHRLKDATEAAYQRGDLLIKRNKLMNAWSGYCTTVKQKGAVVPLKKPRVTRNLQP